jgi:hypothetical protein
VLAQVVALSGLPVTGIWTVAASPATTGLSGVTGTGSTTTVSGLTAGITYTLQYLFWLYFRNL